MDTLNQYCKKTFGEKLYKLSLNGGMACPNRDGTLGDRGCIFCSAGGSGVCACSCTPQCVSFDAPMSYVLRSLNSCALPSFQFCTGR